MKYLGWIVAAIIAVGAYVYVQMETGQVQPVQQEVIQAPLTVEKAQVIPETVVVEEKNAEPKKTEEEAENHNYGFRKINWGMSKKEVKKQENNLVEYEDEGQVGYTVSLLGKQCYLVYYFTENKVAIASYLLTETHMNSNEYINDMSIFKEALIKKYGDPIEDEMVWNDDTYKNDFSNWGIAISTGDLRYYTKWESGDMDIICTLSGDNFKTICRIDYTHRELLKLYQKNTEKDALNNL